MFFCRFWWVSVGFGGLCIFCLVVCRFFVFVGLGGFWLFVRFLYVVVVLGGFGLVLLSFERFGFFEVLELFLCVVCVFKIFDGIGRFCCLFRS